jgi:hypothetical protein
MLLSSKFSLVKILFENQILLCILWLALTLGSIEHLCVMAFIAS